MFLIFVQLMLVTAVALFFSTFSSPSLAAVLTFGLYVVGHFNADLRNFEDVVDSQAVGIVARVVCHLLPNLAAFDVKAQVVHAQSVSLGYMALTSGYAVAYIGMLLLAAVFIFSRRDFK